MTLISCSECKKEISDKSENCIQCGAPLHIILESLDEKEVDKEFQKEKNIISNWGSIILKLFKISVLIILFILIFFIKMFIVIGISVNILGWDNGIQNGYIAFAAIIAAITTFMIVKKQYQLKYTNRLLENIFTQKYFILTAILFSFILWILVFKLSYSIDYKYAKIQLEEMKGISFAYDFGGLIGIFISLNIIPLTLSLIFSFIGKFGFKQNFKQLLGTQILIFTILNLIFAHL